MNDVSWILDIGAYDGKEGLKIRGRIGGEHPILAVEADPENFKKIPEDFPGRKLNLAIAAHDGEIDFFRYQPVTSSVLAIDQEALSRYTDGSTGRPAETADWRAQDTLKIPCRRLDSLCEELGIRRVRYLKVDTQGYDLEVIKSLGSRLAMVDELQCEVQLDRHLIYKGAATLDEMLEYMRDRGFFFIGREPQSYGQELNLYFKRKDLMAVWTKEPLVSVLTPCRNSAAYIRSCVDSVQGQTYPFVEHVVQDALSTDGTTQALESYGKKVLWRSERDGGQSDGLDRALKRCRGDIIGVLNADDEYLPGALAWAVEQFSKYPDAAVIYGQQYNVDETGRSLFCSNGPDPYDFERIFCCEDVIPAQAAFIRRSALEAVGFRIDATRKTCPDYELWVRLGMRFPMRYVPGFVANYRIHSGSEGQQASVIFDMVRSKREVVERVVRDPATPRQVRRLGRRAHAGILRWSTGHFVPPHLNFCKVTVARQYAKAFLADPRPNSLFYAVLYLVSYVWIDVLGRAVRGRRDAAALVDPAQSFREFIGGVRGCLRKLDRAVLQGFIYQRIYLPAKERKAAAHKLPEPRRRTFPGKVVFNERFRGADFSGADLSGSRWLKAAFEDCRFDGARAERADFRGSVFKASSFSGASMQRCNFMGARFERCRFRGASLAGGNFWLAEFRDCDLSDADFADSHLAWTAGFEGRVA